MPKPKKPASEMTDEELKRRIFPKRALEELERIAHEGEEEEESDSDDSSQDKSSR